MNGAKTIQRFIIYEMLWENLDSIRHLKYFSKQYFYI